MKYFVGLTPQEVNVAWGAMYLFISPRIVYAQSTKDGVPIKGFSVFEEKEIKELTYTYNIVIKDIDWLNKYKEKTT